jgi:hypothetical protein
MAPGMSTPALTGTHLHGSDWSAIRPGRPINPGQYKTDRDGSCSQSCQNPEQFAACMTLISAVERCATCGKGTGAISPGPMAGDRAAALPILPAK